jgi:KaiC/GvpD/RAD55 family RecA-like ATPase
MMKKDIIDKLRLIDIDASNNKKENELENNEEQEKVPSGIPGFDELCHGGFEKNSANLIVGKTGTGKSIFINQFIYTGCVFYDEPGVIVNLDNKKEVVYKEAAKFGWLFKDLEKKGIFSFINLKPHELKKIIEEGGGLIWDSVMDIGAKRIAFDSLTSFSLYFEKSYDLRESLINLFDLTKKWKCTSLYSYYSQSEEKIELDKNIEFLADSLIGLYNIKIENVRRRALEIIKMKGSEHVQKIVPFEIITQEGIIVYPSEDIFE